MPAGYVATLAGNGWTCNGPYAPCGDGGPATAAGEQYKAGAKLDLPQGVATDSNGNVYIGDTRDQRIRCVVNVTGGCPNSAFPNAAVGDIVTYAGDGSPDCAEPTDNCGDGEPKSQARFRNPAGVWLDSAGNLYIADQWDNRIREVVSQSGNIETVCGTGTAGYLNGNCIHKTKAPVEFYGPLAVIVDSLGNLTVADSGNGLIRQAQLATGAISTIAGSGLVGDGGPATLASLANPDDVKWDLTGTNYGYLIVDNGNNRRCHRNYASEDVKGVTEKAAPSPPQEYCPGWQAAVRCGL